MIKLNLRKSAFIPKFFPLLQNYENRWEFWCGSAGSGKSYTIAQKLIIRCCKEPIKILVCRRYASTLRNSCFSLFKEVLNKWKLSPFVKINESDFRIRFPNGSEIIMTGLDNEEKLLSLNNISTIWIEEAFEVEQSKVEQLNLRMRGQANNQQLILSWNPISKSSWLYHFTVEAPPQSSIFIHSTYKDNPFLNKEYIQSLDEMAVRNPAKYRVYGLGEWGVNTEALVFSNWTIAEFNPMELSAKGLEHRAGIDLGWVDKTAITDSLWDRENHTIYVFNEFYKSGCQLSEVASALDNMNMRKVKIYVDAAEPRSINFFRKEGFNAVGCKKGKDSVNAGIDFLKDNKIVILPACKNLIMEMENFSYIKSKMTGELTNETTHEFSHAIDSLRYGYSDVYTNKKIKTIDKSILGL